MSKKILDWKEYTETARLAAAEGCVLLKNENNTLPFDNKCRVSLFGRAQNNYFKSGTGSGGMVNVSRVIDIPAGLRDSGEVVINEELASIYADWETKNPPVTDAGWGKEPWSYPEMPLSSDIVKRAADVSDAALIIIGRNGGEDRDIYDIPGSYRLTDEEIDMINAVSEAFSRTAVVINSGNFIDMPFCDNERVGAVLYVWQGGMIGGAAAADVITGKITPSGKLMDTAAFELADYPSYNYFGGEDKNFYTEDIYVGYRWFETFAPEKVRFPFGYGLSYTKFDIKTLSAEKKGNNVRIDTIVKNVGGRAGKEVVQIYVSAPQGELGKPLRELKAYKKTGVIAPGASENISFEFDINDFASYDSTGVSGFRSSYVLEKGKYRLFCGSDVRSAAEIFSFDIDENICVCRLEEAMAPVEEFEIIKPVFEGDKLVPAKVTVPLMTVDENKRIIDSLPADIPYSGDKGIKLSDVRDGRNSMEEFISQLSDSDLACIIRGEGMSTPLVTAGTAAAFGGVSPTLRGFGIPAVCCDDGPSGLRLDSGVKAFSLPVGTCLSCTFNDELVEKLYSFTGIEMAVNEVECLLGPGMNIHRHPLNGRNFEYFSEDPLLSGKIAAAAVRGMRSSGVTGVIKHFCGNNQEYHRHWVNNNISERALREIYLKGFETAVKEGKADSVMTTYGPVNGLWTAGNYDLCTVILRKEWGFTGIVMTDWWANINLRGKPQSRTEFAAMNRAQNDLYMVCPNGSENAHGDNTEESLANGTLTRGELCRSAVNICRFAMNSLAMKRMLGEADEITVINRPDEDSLSIPDDAVTAEIKGSAEFDLTFKHSYVGVGYAYLMKLEKTGNYRITLFGSSELGDLAQIPCTLLIDGKAASVFVFNGTGGREVSVEKNIVLDKKELTFMIYVGQIGIDLTRFRIEYEE